MRRSLLALALVTFQIQAAGTCTWCVLGNSRATRAALTLASEETPKKMLEKVRSEGISVKVLNSGRTVPKNFFHWGSLERTVGPMESLSQNKGVMGKTLCKGEHPLAGDGVTIFLASDAPKSTLIHEYLHTFQIQGDPAWCPISKAIWDSGRMSREAMILMQDREWDVHRWLWENRDALKLAVEDRVNIGANLMDQASLRAPRDPSVRVYLKKQKVNEELDRDVAAYRKALGLPR